MKNNVVLYRKYRPQTFDEVVGQDSVVKSLRNEIVSGKHGHAYLFCGPHGTGKTTMARIFARSLNCINPQNGNPCNQCTPCTDIIKQASVDVVEVDAASNNGVENVREIIDQSQYMPRQGVIKVYIIDEVHMLSMSAFNALLKTLEEPTPNTVFILATTEFHKVPATIVSRCQRITFNYIQDYVIIDKIKDILNDYNIAIDKNAVTAIAGIAKGSMRDALTSLQQVLSYTEWKQVTEQDVKFVFGSLEGDTIESLIQAINSSKPIEAIQIIHGLQLEGKQLSAICIDLYEYYREEYFHNPNVDIAMYQRNMKTFAELSEKVDFVNNPAVLEIELIKLCNPQTSQDISLILKRLTHVENVLELAMHGRIEDAVKEYEALNFTTMKSQQKTEQHVSQVNSKPNVRIHLIS